MAFTTNNVWAKIFYEDWGMLLTTARKRAADVL